jgi:hypothetical protein
MHGDSTPVSKNYETTATKNCTALLCKIYVLFLLPTNNTMMKQQTQCAVLLCENMNGLVNHWCSIFCCMLILFLSTKYYETTKARRTVLCCCVKIGTAAW